MNTGLPAGAAELLLAPDRIGAAIGAAEEALLTPFAGPPRACAGAFAEVVRGFGLPAAALTA